MKMMKDWSARRNEPFSGPLRSRRTALVAAQWLQRITGERCAVVPKGSIFYILRRTAEGKVVRG